MPMPRNGGTVREPRSLDRDRRDVADLDCHHRRLCRHRVILAFFDRTLALGIDRERRGQHVSHFLALRCLWHAVQYRRLTGLVSGGHDLGLRRSLLHG
jgi:hypothetical protein